MLTFLSRVLYDRRHYGQHRGGHGPFAFDVQTIANANGGRDEDAEQPGGAQAGAVGVVRRDQTRVRQAGRRRSQGTVRRQTLGRPFLVRGVVAARARRRRHGTAVAEFRLVRRDGHRHHVVVGRRTGRPGRLSRSAVVQTPAVPQAAVVRRKGAGRRGVRTLFVPGRTVENEQVVVWRREPEVGTGLGTVN